MCQVSHVRCTLSFFIFLFCEKSGPASRWRVCYQLGLPRLVLLLLIIYIFWDVGHSFGHVHKVALVTLPNLASLLLSPNNKEHKKPY